MKQIILLLVITNLVLGAKYKEIIIDSTFEHVKYETAPVDLCYKFAAFTLSFDSEDDDNGDGEPDTLRVPQWVSYEIKKRPKLERGPGRPNPWIYEKDLYKAKLAPKDASYMYSTQFRKEYPNWYERGHMCMKQIAFRISEAADWNTHTMINACPQKKYSNKGIWLDMEYLTQEWANEFGRVWVVCGPVFYDYDFEFIGEEEKGELLVPIPDAFYKIVIREIGDGKISTLSFIYPQDTEETDRDHLKYTVSIDSIEAATGLDFLSNLEEEVQNEVEKIIPTVLW